MIHYNINEISIKNKHYYIRGWAFDTTEDLLIQFKPNQGNIKITERLDVNKHFDLAQGDLGFEIYLPLFVSKVKIIFSTLSEKKEEQVMLYPVLRVAVLNKLKFVAGKFSKKNILAMLVYYKKHGFRATANKIRHQFSPKQDYHNWFVNYHSPSLETLKMQREKVFPYQPLISVVTPTFNTPKQFLIEMIESVRAQTYPHWELCIADGASANKDTIAILQKYVKKDKRIKVVFLKENYHISGNTNEAIKLALGEYIGFLDHDDKLTPNCLFEFIKKINHENKPALLYSDEDVMNENGSRYLHPHFKPDFSPHLLLSYNYITHFCMIQKNILEKIGFFKENMNGAQDYDIILRTCLESENIAHIPLILYHWRQSSSSTSSNALAKPYAHQAGLNSLSDYVLKKYNKDTKVIEGNHLFTYKLSRTLHPAIMVSIIIPTKDGIDLLKPCLESIFEISTFKNFEIIILNNNSTLPETYLWFDEISKKYNNVKVVNANYPFNWSKLNNHGISESSGNVYIFLNNDIKIITPNWIEELANYALDTDVGVVGALLLYDDNTIQHAGVVVGMNGWADHIFKQAHLVHFPTPFVSPVISRDVLAVTGACMAISKEKIEKIGLFDENFIICGSDVEICLRSHELGFYNFINTSAKLYHYESKTRDSYIPEIDFECSAKAYSKYILNGDPFFNPNLNINSTTPILKYDA